MRRLFAPFDQNAILSLPLNWLVAAAAVVLLTPSYWMGGSQLATAAREFTKYIYGEFKAISGFYYAPGAL